MTLVAFHETEVSSANQAIYNGGDVCLTSEIFEAEQGLRRNDQLIYDFEKSLQGPTLEMMLRGFKVDLDARDKALIGLDTQRESVERIIQGIVTAIQGNYNTKLPNSPKQLGNLFYNIMRLKPIAKHQSGETKYPMDRETLEKLALQSDWAAPIINAILLHRDTTKAKQVLETEIDPDWRWRCSYNIGGTKTGRFSSSKSPFGTGNNFQNVTEELRRVFIPDPGYKLYGIDKAQSEARDVGWFCGTVLGDWSYLDACESGDLHTTVTKMTYTEWDWPNTKAGDRALADRQFFRHFTYRDASKRLAHATNYLVSAAEAHRQIRIPLDFVTEFQQRYFRAFPCIPRMHQWVAQQLQRHRFLINSFGRRRDFFDRPEDRETLKSAIAYLFQSATADCLNLGMWRLWKKMGRRVQLLSQLHDAVYFQAPISDEETERELIRDSLRCVQITQLDSKSSRSMTIPGEPVGGFNWAHRYRLKDDGTVEDWNPKGLDKVRI